MVVGEAVKKTKHIKSDRQLEIKFAVTTAQVLRAARKLNGHTWTTSDIAGHLRVKEHQVRAAVSWLVSQQLIKDMGETKRNLSPSAKKPGKYTVTVYAITEAGISHDYERAHRGESVGHYGDVAALEMALGFCRAYIRH